MFVSYLQICNFHKLQIKKNRIELKLFLTFLLFIFTNLVMFVIKSLTRYGIEVLIFLLYNAWITLLTCKLHGCIELSFKFAIKQVSCYLYSLKFYNFIDDNIITASVLSSFRTRAITFCPKCAHFILLSNNSAQKVSHICLNVILLLKLLHKLVEQVGRMSGWVEWVLYTFSTWLCFCIRPRKQVNLISWFDGPVKYVLILDALLRTCFVQTHVHYMCKIAQNKATEQWTCSKLRKFSG